MMLFKTAALLLALTPSSFGREWDYSGKFESTQRMNRYGGEPYINYTTITGFFLQDINTTVPSTFDYTTTNYGLINQTYSTDEKYDPEGTKTQWQRFEYYIDSLNQEADKNTQYKVLFLGRHGEGYHNAAETFYGTPAWNCYWSELDGNGTVVWKDALLTTNGVAQANKANAFWKSQLADQKMPAPQSYYTSPLSRCLITANLTFNGLELPAGRAFVPTVKELFREGISMHTCDSRGNKSYIHDLFPSWRIEANFTEYDELWTGTEAETGDAQLKRSRTVLDDVFGGDGNTWLSITSHSGEIAKILSVLGHQTFGLSTGQAIPVLVKAVNERKTEVPATTVVSWSSAATCTSPPVTSLSDLGCVCSSGTGLASMTATATATALA